MVTGLFCNTSDRLFAPGSERLVDGAPLGRTLPGTFGKVTPETNPTVDARSYLSVRMARLEESCDCSPLGLAFLFTARPFDAQTKHRENLAPAAFGQQSTPKNLNRWYDASVGRWLSEDPISFDGGEGNVYRYVGNETQNRFDPEGLWLEIWTGVNPEGKCCKKPTKAWMYWRYRSHLECVAHQMVMVQLRPGGFLFGSGAAARSIIAQLAKAGNFAQIISVLGAGFAAEETARRACNLDVCDATDVVPPKCDLYEYHAWGLSWLWKCYRLYCRCPSGSVDWTGKTIWSPRPLEAPTWDLQRLASEAAEDWPSRLY